jgi:integrase
MTELEVPSTGLALRGTPPAHDEYELADLMRAAGLPPVALAATAGWLSSEKRSSPATKKGYSQDLSWWLAYIRARGLNPMDVPPREADLYGAAMRQVGLSPATRERRTSAVSSWYTYVVRDGAAVRNPFFGMERAKVDPVSKTRSLSKDELDRMLAWADQTALDTAAAYAQGRAARSRARDTARTSALLWMLVVTACRVGGVIDAQFSDLGYDRGLRVVDLPVKGPLGKTQRHEVTPHASDALDRYLALRGDDDGPLFRTDTGNPLDQPAIFRQVRRIAEKAGVKHKISVHSLRHAVATYLMDVKDKPTHRAQGKLGHADPRTTIRYNLAQGALDGTGRELDDDFARGAAQYMDAEQ